MMKATLQDKASVVSVLSASFAHNKSVGFVAGNGPGRSQRIRKLMEYSFLTCLDFGEVWLSECQSCCALVLFPDQKKHTLKSAWRDIGLIFSVIRLRLFQVLRRENLVKAHYDLHGVGATRLPGFYLWFIGTNPSRQRRGEGSRMLRMMLDRAADLDRKVFLETSVSTNLVWYRRFGLDIYDQVELGYPLYFLRK